MKSERKNLLFVQLQSDLYGSSRSLLRLVGALDPTVYRVVVLVSDVGALSSQLEGRGAKVIRIPHVGAIERWSLFSWRSFLLPFEIVSATVRILRVIRRERVGLVHSNTSIILAAALAAKIARVPHVCHVREIYDEFPVFWKLHRRFISWSSREIVCISKAVAGQFTDRRSRIIPNGLDLDAECRARPDPEALRKSLGLDGSLLAGCIGRIKWRRKGQEVLIRALALLKERGVRMNALIVGSPFPGYEPHLQQMQAMAGRLGVTDQVRFLPEQPDVWPFYALMDIFVMPSVMPEPLGNVILEAMAMGVPVIASRCGGAIDLIEEGKSGLLFEPGNDVELADKLTDLLLHPQRRRELGEGGRRRQGEEFSLARCADRIDALYRQLLGLPARGEAGKA